MTLALKIEDCTVAQKILPAAELWGAKTPLSPCVVLGLFATLQDRPQGGHKSGDGEKIGSWVC